MLVAGTALATADDETEYPVKQTSYTTGAQGSKLTWLPYRPDADSVRRHASESGVSIAQFEAPTAPGQKADDPLKDPFGDKRAANAAEPKPVAASKEKAEASSTLPVLPADTDSPTASEPPKSEAKPAEKSLPRLWVEKEATKPGNGPLLSPTPNDSRVPSLADELATNAKRGEDGCPSSSAFKPIWELTNQIAAKEGAFPPECPLKAEQFEPRSWSPTTFAWKATGLCHKPLYFEDVQLERYGHSWGPYLQPVISQGHFFLTIPILPYLMGVDPPCECAYTLGYYRPGSCAPYMLDPLPISVRAGLLEAGVVTGAAFLVP